MTIILTLLHDPGLELLAYVTDEINMNYGYFSNLMGWGDLY